MKIAFFDSGIGGLSVLSEAFRHFSNTEFLYFADTKNVPYGIKSKDEIIKLSFDAVEFLVSKGAKAVVVACNTATSAAINELRESFNIPIIGMEPAIKLANDKFHGYPILLIATPLTIKGEKLSNLIAKTKSEVWGLPMPKLVECAENLKFESVEVKNYIKDEFSKFELDRASSLVLGCTHFNYFKDSFREILPENVEIIDGNLGTINRLIDEIGKFYNYESDKLINAKPSQNNKTTYFYSKNELSTKELKKIKTYLNRLEKMREIN